MDRVLSNLKPERVMYFFEEIARIPHGSHNTKALSDYCVDFAKCNHLEVRQDEANNVIIKKVASLGYEKCSTLIIQGHLDMVCEKNEDVIFDFENQPLELKVDGDFISANGTTLGADDGIAIAYCLAILEDKTIKHPNLEVIFTTEEEVGMDGAVYLQTSDLKGQYLLNIDSENEGEILAGCAGGLKSTGVFNYKAINVEGCLCKLSIKGLQGGHSGMEINNCRANSNITMGRVLYHLHKEISYCLKTINGGMKDNAIPRECFVELVINQEDIERVQSLIMEIKEQLTHEMQNSDKNFELLLDIMPIDEYTVIDPMSTSKVIYLLFNVINGVQSMSYELPGIVESSLNLGVIETAIDSVTFKWAIRSAVHSKKIYINDRVKHLVEFLGGDYYFDGIYPEWEFKSHSKMQSLLKDTYQELFDQEAVVTAVHAGLECGLFAEKMPYLDMVAIGPNMYGIHTPEEKISISSIQRYYHYILAILENFKNYCD